MHVMMKIIVLVTSWRMVCAADTNSDYCFSNILKNGMCCLCEQWLLC